jgi:hypothetical protein
MVGVSLAHDEDHPRGFEGMGHFSSAVWRQEVAGGQDDEHHVTRFHMLLEVRDILELRQCAVDAYRVSGCVEVGRLACGVQLATAYLR